MWEQPTLLLVGQQLWAGPWAALSPEALQREAFMSPPKDIQSSCPMLQVRKQGLGEGRNLSMITASTREPGVKPKSDLEACVFLTAFLSLECPPLFLLWLVPPHLSLNVTPQRGLAYSHLHPLLYLSLLLIPV